MRVQKAGGGKYGIVDDVFMAAKIGKVAKVVRTHPPRSLAGAGAGVDALTFSGTYPLTRLAITDEEMLPTPGDRAADTAAQHGGTAPGAGAGAAGAGGGGGGGAAAVTAEVFGYSTLKPGSLKASAYPAIVRASLCFSLLLSDADADADADAS